MIRCPQCAYRFDSSASKCAACAWTPATVDGFTSWAPELTAGGTGLSDHSFSLISRFEQRHFWFRSRNAVITWALSRYFPDLRTFLEIGCGTGIVLSAVQAAFPAALLTGSEIASAGLALASRQAPRTLLVQMDGRRIPYESEFDVVGAFDVLEHIVEDEAVLDQMRQAITPGGGLLITVPQHAWLWSAVDDYSRHQRRYSRQELVAKIRRAGFVIDHVTSFMTLILPAMLLSRGVKRDADSIDPGSELRIGGVVNGLFGGLCAIERAAIRTRFSLPVGGSLLVVARRA